MADNGAFSLEKFIGNLGGDNRRVSKGYMYEVTFNFNKLNPQMKPMISVDTNKLTFFCTDANIPGWRADTASTSIYGVKYEVITRIEQDPLWITFMSDILHKIPSAFMHDLKLNSAGSMFGKTSSPTGLNSYSPRYKKDSEFETTINILDEEFNQIARYNFSNCILKTVQQMTLGVANREPSKVTIEIVYEHVKFEHLSGHSRPAVQNVNYIAPQGIYALNPNAPIMSTIQNTGDPSAPTSSTAWGSLQGILTTTKSAYSTYQNIQSRISTVRSAVNTGRNIPNQVTGVVGSFGNYNWNSTQGVLNSAGNLNRSILKTTQVVGRMNITINNLPARSAPVFSWNSKQGGWF